MFKINTREVITEGMVKILEDLETNNLKEITEEEEDINYSYLVYFFKFWG